jgi:hypothetical protein
MHGCGLQKYKHQNQSQEVHPIIDKAEQKKMQHRKMALVGGLATAILLWSARKHLRNLISDDDDEGRVDPIPHAYDIVNIINDPEAARQFMAIVQEQQEVAPNYDEIIAGN